MVEPRRCRHEGRRRTTPPLRRRRPRHRAARCSSTTSASPGTLWAKALRSPVAPRGRSPSLDTLEGRGDEGRPRGHHLEGRAAARVRPPLRARHPGRRAAAREGRGALQGPADRGRRGRGRGDRAGGRRGDRPRASRSSRRSSTSARRSTPTRRRSTSGATGTRTSRARWTGARSARARSTRRSSKADVIVQGVYRPAAIEHVPIETQVCQVVPEAERPADDLLLHAGALLLDGRRRRAPAGAAEQAQVRRRHGRRRLRRQGRHRDRDDVRAARAEVGPAGEVALDARGGVPLLVDARAVAHGDRGRRDEGRLDPRPQDADAARLGRLRALLAVRPDEAQLPPHRRLHDPEPRVRRLRRLHEPRADDGDARVRRHVGLVRDRDAHEPDRARARPRPVRDPAQEREPDRRHVAERDRLHRPVDGSHDPGGRGRARARAVGRLPHR